MINNQPITSATLEYISLNGDRDVDRITSGYDLICMVNGSCRYEDSRGTHEALKNSMHILTPGSRMTEYRVGSSGLFEQVVISIEGDALFGRVDHRDREEERFEEAILCGLASNISIEELAKKCCHSTSTFKRRFRERYGISPHRWFLGCRLAIAERILSQTRIPTNIIASLAGFINVSHFIATYRRRFGYTPTRTIRERYSRHIAVSEHK
ncbi:MAG: helix-turn-helix transcriptional regulator [Alistipes sp.]|nr:helix-turn-helix transcriptional regulator [Alistipes sp.]